ncbi:YegS/Rv2252/BmrU family lipid kinase [Mycoplasmatota bacterium]|nr:YegS/Rv2252/BmrU family lipid kinase [Mycoplasmatota bacterium]
MDVYESKGKNDLNNYAFKMASSYDVFLVCGGDGTINEVINGVMKSEIKPAIAIIPCGTANDIAAILGIPKNYKRALKIYFKEKPMLMDINQMNDRYFVYAAASGVLSKISYDISRNALNRYGYLAYVFEGMKDLAQDYSYKVNIKHDEGQLLTECMMVLGLSSNRVGGMRLYNFSHSKLNDGLFELRVFTRKRRFRRFRFLSSFLRGGRKLREDYHITSSKLDIKTDDHVVWNTDGEQAATGDVLIQVHANALKVYMHPKVKRKQFNSVPK